jgi:polyisoprenoid-binding protein YceI
MSTMSTLTAPAVTEKTKSVWNIDPVHTLVEFAVRHMMITTVKGRFAEVSGSIVFDEVNPGDSSVEVEIAAASIDTRTEQRDQHLRSADFLDADNHPKLIFRSTRVVGGIEAGTEFEVVGDLTIRGVTREVVVRSRLEGKGIDPWGGERVSFSGETRIDREAFGLTWNQALETGGLLVSNEIRISIEAQAVKAV